MAWSSQIKQTNTPLLRKTSPIPSSKFSKQAEGTYELKGDLTIKDNTQPITLNVEFGGIMKDPWGNNKAGFSLSGKINRKDWGLNWNAALETGGVLVSDE